MEVLVLSDMFKSLRRRLAQSLVVSRRGSTLVSWRRTYSNFAVMFGADSSVGVPGLVGVGGTAGDIGRLLRPKCLITFFGAQVLVWTPDTSWNLTLEGVGTGFGHVGVVACALGSS